MALRMTGGAGGYPDGGALDPGRFPEWQESYLALLAQRDLPSWGLPAQPQTIDRLLRMTANVHGQLLNLSRVARCHHLLAFTCEGGLGRPEQVIAGAPR